MKSGWELELYRENREIGFSSGRWFKSEPHHSCTHYNVDGIYLFYYNQLYFIITMTAVNIISEYLDLMIDYSREQSVMDFI